MYPRTSNTLLLGLDADLTCVGASSMVAIACGFCGDFERCLWDRLGVSGIGAVGSGRGDRPLFCGVEDLCLGVGVGFTTEFSPVGRLGAFVALAVLGGAKGLYATGALYPGS